MLKQTKIKKSIVFIAICICFFAFNNRVKADQIACYYRINEFGPTGEDIRLTYENSASNSVPTIQYIGKTIKMNAVFANFKVSDFISKYECPKELHGVNVEIAKKSGVYSGRFYLDRKDAVSYAQKVSGNVLTAVNAKTSQQATDSGSTDTSGTPVGSPEDLAKTAVNAAPGALKTALLTADVKVTVKEGSAGSDDGGCSKLGGLSKYIGGGFSFVRYAAPTLIIVFSVIDFLGVVLSGEDDKMEKAKKNFIIRIIVGILILFVPFILEFILRIAGIIDGSLADAACNFIK